MTTRGKMAQQQYNDKNSSACSYRLLMIVSLFGFLLDYTAQAASPSTPSSAAAESKRNYLIARARISKDRDNESRPTVIYPRGGAAGASLKKYQKRFRRRLGKLEDRDENGNDIGSSPSPLLLGHSLNNSPSDTKSHVFSRTRSHRNEEDHAFSLSSSSSSQHSMDNNEASSRDTTSNNVAIRNNSVIYQYFGRSRARSIRSDSIPFIVIGPCVDHWKLVGRILASRGFNVVVIERVKKSKKKSFSSEEALDDIHEGEALVRCLLDVLKWQRAILVGCDEESILCIEAAMRLAPERIVGLVLCGDLSSFHHHMEQQITNMKIYSTGEETNHDDSIDIEFFLQHYVECPCQFIWDGDVTSWPSVESEDMSKVILGGGLAPHRRLPEQFAWTLSRFVEKKVSSLPTNPSLREINSQGFDDDESSTPESEVSSTDKNHIQNRTILPNSRIFAPGTFLVAGRVIATVIIYLSIAKASVVQYHNLRDIPSTYFNLSKLQLIKNCFKKVRKMEVKTMITTANATTIPRKMLSRIRSQKGKKKGVHEEDEEEKENLENGDDSPTMEKSTPEESSPPDEEEDGDNSQKQDEEKKGSGDTFTPFLQKLLFLDQIIS